MPSRGLIVHCGGSPAPRRQYPPEIPLRGRAEIIYEGTMFGPSLPLPRALPVLKSLAQRHDCIVLQFRDPAERGLPGAGWMRVREAETGRTVVSRDGGAWSNQEQIADELRRGAVDYVLIDTDRPFVPRLRHFFKSRGQIGQGTR